MRKRALTTIFFLLWTLPLMAEGEMERWMDHQDYTKALFSSLFIFIGLIIGVMALVYNYRHQDGPKGKFLTYAWKNPLVKITLVTSSVIVMVTLSFSNPDLSIPENRIRVAELRGRPYMASSAYQQLINDDPGNPAWHVQYLMTLYQQDDWDPGHGGYKIPMAPVHPVERYEQMITQNRGRMQNIGKLGVGICKYYQVNTEDAFELLMEVSERKLPYLHLFIGRCYSRFGMSEKAIIHYEKELRIAPDRSLAVNLLGYEYKRNGRMDDLKALINDPATGPYAAKIYSRFVYTKEARLFPYFKTVLKQWVNGTNLTGLIGALAGMLVWMYFLRQVAVFRRHHWVAQIGMVLLGGIFTFTAIPFYDYLDFELGFDLNGELGHDFLYSIFGIGIIEESVKIIPFLLVLRYSNAIRVPLDYIIFASLSALGFAFIENLRYFDEGNLTIIHSRILTASVFHMFASSTIAFGLVLAKYRYGTFWKLGPKGTRVAFFVVFFLLAALLHGFYDFWLLNPVAGKFIFLTFSLFIYATFQYASYINNCLNHSPLFRGSIAPNTGRIAGNLLTGLIAILLFEYISQGILFGGRNANYALFRSLGMGGFLMFFVVLNLTYIDVVQGEWFGIRFWNFGNRLNFNRAIGKKITLVPAKKGSIMSPILPLNGEIIARVKLVTDNRYFLLRLDKRIQMSGNHLEYLLVKSKDRNAVIEPGYQMEVAVIIFKNREALLKKRKERKDFKLLDYAVVK